MTAAWFDEVYEERENVRTFKRNEQVKEILFEVLKHNIKGHDIVSVEELINCLGLKWWNGNRAQSDAESYFSWAFGRSA